MIDPRDKRPAYQQIADHYQQRMEQRIEGFRPGDELPTLARTAGLFGVSVETARQALAHLDRRGVIATRQGKPALVVQPPPDPARVKAATWEEFHALARRVDGLAAQIQALAELVRAQQQVLSEIEQALDGTPLSTEPGDHSTP